MSESDKRKASKKPGGRAQAPRPGRNSEGTRKKGKPGQKMPQLQGASDTPMGPPPPMAPPGAPATAIEPPPSPSPPVPGMMGGAPGMPPGMPPGAPPGPGPAGAPPPGGPGMAPPPNPGVGTPVQGMAQPAAGMGMPPEIQGMPGDMAALQATMQTGFGPGSSMADHDAAMVASAQAKAIEQAAMHQAFSQDEDEMNLMELGRIMAQLMGRRQPPQPMR